jgi:hypothetical protein
MNTLKLISLFVLFTILFSCEEEKFKISEENTDPDARSEIIQAEEIMKKLQKNENIMYKNATILGDIDFTLLNDTDLMTPLLVKHHVHSSIIFYNCTFKNKIIAQKTHTDHSEICEFERSVSLMNCTFQDTIDFSSAEFNDIVNFSDSEFHLYTSFKDTNLKYKRNYFDRAKFYANTFFNHMNVNGLISFFQSQFDQNILFQKSIFSGNVKFQASVFNGSPVFDGAKFRDDVSFGYSKFQKNAMFNNVLFQGNTEFTKTVFNERIQFNNCNFYGQASYNKSVIKGVFTIKDSFFLQKKPTKKDFVIDKSAKVYLIFSSN